MARHDLRNRLVLITGGARGLGLGMARAFGERGAHIVLWDMDGPALAQASAGLGSVGVRVRTDIVDLTNPQAVNAAAASVLEQEGPVDVLVNNAGIVAGKTLLELTDAEIERTFEVNTLALFRTTRAFLPEMLKRDAGCIVTIASAGGIVGTSRLVDYCSSKFAAVGFDDSLRAELKRLGSAVRTTVICPIFVNTGMFDGVKTRVPWLLPILEPDYVVARTVKAVEKGTNRVILPRFVYSAYLMRLLPVPLFDRIATLLGMNASMDEFKGRQ